MKKTTLSTVAAVNIFLVVLITVMLAFIGTIGYTYLKLLTSRPLENLVARVTQPVIAGQPHLEFTGTFDRAVTCEVSKFNLLLHNSTTNDVYILDRRHLVYGPSKEKGPGIGLEVEFTLEMPTSLRTGFWTPTFEGEYVCRLGLFTEVKHETVTLAGFYVQPAK